MQNSWSDIQHTQKESPHSYSDLNSIQRQQSATSLKQDLLLGLLSSVLLQELDGCPHSTESKAYFQAALALTSACPPACKKPWKIME